MFNSLLRMLNTAHFLKRFDIDISVIDSSLGVRGLVTLTNGYGASLALKSPESDLSRRNVS
jgi:hypothetical protein